MRPLLAAVDPYRPDVAGPVVAPRPRARPYASGPDHGWSGPGSPHRSDPLCCRAARRVQPPAVGSHAADDPG